MDNGIDALTDILKMSLFFVFLETEILVISFYNIKELKNNT